METKKKKEKKVPDPKLVEIGRRVRAVRLAKGLTMEQVVEKADTSTQFLSKVEKGEQGMTIGKFSSLVKALDVSADYLLFGLEGHSEQEALLVEMVRQLSPMDLILLGDIFAKAGGLINAIRPDIKQIDSN